MPTRAGADGRGRNALSVIRAPAHGEDRNIDFAANEGKPQARYGVAASPATPDNHGAMTCD